MLKHQGVSIRPRTGEQDDAFPTHKVWGKKKYWAGLVNMQPREDGKDVGVPNWFGHALAAVFALPVNVSADKGYKRERERKTGLVLLACETAFIYSQLSCWILPTGMYWEKRPSCYVEHVAIRL